MPLAPGTWLNHYEILEHIGSGGMGEVYRAHDNKLNREVARRAPGRARSVPAGPSTRGFATTHHSRSLLPHGRGSDNHFVLKLLEETGDAGVERQ